MPAAGSYDVNVTYACENDAAGSHYTVGVGSTVVGGQVASTGSWTDFKSVELGNITLQQGRPTLAVRIVNMPHFAAMNLRQVRLTPAK